jgi:hypothetical protein
MGSASALDEQCHFRNGDCGVLDSRAYPLLAHLFYTTHFPIISSRSFMLFVAYLLIISSLTGTLSAPSPIVSILGCYFVVESAGKSVGVDVGRIFISAAWDSSGGLLSHSLVCWLPRHHKWYSALSHNQSRFRCLCRNSRRVARYSTCYMPF